MEENEADGKEGDVSSTPYSDLKTHKVIRKQAEKATRSIALYFESNLAH
jgi:hypothetical protein